MSQPAPAGQHTVKEHNLALVLGLIAEASRAQAEGGISRARLATAAGLTRATAGSLVDQLVADGLVMELEPERGERGRPPSPVRLRPDGACGIGVEINVDYIAVCALDLTGAVLADWREAMDIRQLSPDDALRHAAMLVQDLHTQLPAPPATVREPTTGGRRISGIGLALPGLVDAGGRLRRAPNLPGWDGLDAAAGLRSHLGATSVATAANAGESNTATDVSTHPAIRAANEANLAALAERWYGGERGLDDFILVSGEIGVGAGIVIAGRVFDGVHGYAGELGHVVVDPGGRSCHCGGRGCLEQLAGQDAMVRAAGLDPDRSGVDELVTAATQGHAQTLAALQGAGVALGRALASAANLLDVSTVVLGGCYARLATWLREPVAEQLNVQIASRVWTRPQVIISSLGPGAAVRGAAGWVVHEVLAGPGTTAAAANRA